MTTPPQSGGAMTTPPQSGGAMTTPPQSGGARILVLAATDPANAWGAIIDWPPSPTDARPQRSAGARVVLRDGVLLGWMGRGDHPLITFLPEGEPDRTAAAHALAGALAGLVDGGSRPVLLVSSIDGVHAADSPLRSVFAHAGFVATARGLFKRRAVVAPEPRREMAMAARRHDAE
jgi:ATP-dependent Lhr-like helicase